MQSPKFMFYISSDDKTISFNKNILLTNDNKIKYNEIHITQIIIHPKLKKSVMLLNGNDRYYTSLNIDIENFNENIVNFSENKYTLTLLDMMSPYNYDGTYSSKIINNSSFVLNGENIELKFVVKIGNDSLNFYTENVSDEKEYEFDADETLIELELFFK